MEARSFKNILKKIRSVGTFWIAKQSIDHLNAIRTHELNIILTLLPPVGNILEIGSGTGWQANILEARGYQVDAIDLAWSNLKENRVRSILEYDGKHIPFPNRYFDIVFSSNVLEHIPHIYDFQKEIHRVLKPDGLAIHVVPSGSWRFWTNITHLLKHWTIPPVHGEHAGNALTEIYYFSQRQWARLFGESGWTIVNQTSNRLFYTGCSLFDSRLSLESRIKLHRLFGSSCHIFILRNSKKL
jgi:SAM-dependent methyltransferase